MPSFDDDEDRDLAGSQDGSSENDLEDTMRDADADDGDGDGVGDSEAEIDGEADEDVDTQSNASQRSEGDDESGEQASQSNQEISRTPSAPDAASHTRGLPLLPPVRPEVLTATTYDIVPTTAAPQSTSINAITATADTRWVFSGGSDGYIRKYNWVESINGKLTLTVAQKHPFVDSVIKAGVLMGYWENWDTRSRAGSSQGANSAPVLSAVYSLAVQSQGLWLLGGTESGNIRLQSIRHDECKEIALLQRHTSAVSVLTLSSDERSLLSGSWDKSVLDWDLNTGQVRTTFSSGTGQISAIESRPVSSVPVPEELNEPVVTNGTYSANIQVNGIADMSALDGPVGGTADLALAERVTSPNSLFGDDDAEDDLFGDSAGGVMPNGSLDDTFGEDEENAPPIGSLLPDDSNDITMADATSLQPVQPPSRSNSTQEELAKHSPLLNGISSTSEAPTLVANGLPHSDADDLGPKVEAQSDVPEAPPTADSTFLATSIDGTIRIWDRRIATPAARIQPRNAPPWCMSACWSPDGNYIYAGRRNCTVEEYDMRKGLQTKRILKFPSGSGAVTAVKAMPNQRHLIWCAPECLRFNARYANPVHSASYDILRLYDLQEPQSTRSTVPFLIVPGHRTGVISQLYMDPACRFMISTGGNRGWEGATTEVLLGYEIGVT